MFKFFPKVAKLTYLSENRIRVFIMGVEKDYLMRQLMLLFEVIQKILRYRKKGEVEQAEEEIQRFYSFLKIDEVIEKLSIEELTELLETKKELGNEQIEMVAFVLKEQGELTQEKERKINFFRKAYFLLSKVERESTSFSMDRQMKLSELASYLN
ncbi:hypothetical protein [uncultured Draconibacterium sp.]|uniref:hypothetical protein n=1 Tax=uncultured Draconibacterium sp. TaxID=1573823 RepID=UPI003261380B